MNFRGPADQALRRDMMMEPLFALLVNLVSIYKFLTDQFATELDPD